MKPTLKKVSKYENKFAKLQKKAAEFNFRNQLKQVKKKEFTLEEEDKEVRIIVFNRKFVSARHEFHFFKLFFPCLSRSTRVFLEFIKTDTILQEYKQVYSRRHVSLLAFTLIIFVNLIFSIVFYIFIKQFYNLISLDKFIANFWILQWNADFWRSHDGQVILYSNI